MIIINIKSSSYSIVSPKLSEYKRKSSLRVCLFAKTNKIRTTTSVNQKQVTGMSKQTGQVLPNDA